MIEGFGNAIVHVVQFLGRDAIGRQNVNHVAERAQQDAGVEEKFIKLRTQARGIAGIVGAQFDSGDGADGANVADSGMILDGREAVLMNAIDGVDALEDWFGFENLQAGNRGRGGNGISGVGMAMVKRAAAIAADEGLDGSRPCKPWPQAEERRR